MTGAFGPPSSCDSSARARRRRLASAELGRAPGPGPRARAPGLGRLRRVGLAALRALRERWRPVPGLERSRRRPREAADLHFPPPPVAPSLSTARRSRRAAPGMFFVSLKSTSTGRRSNPVACMRASVAHACFRVPDAGLSARVSCPTKRLLDGDGVVPEDGPERLLLLPRRSTDPRCRWRPR